MDTKFNRQIVIGVTLLALLGFSGCTETVVYRQPAPPPAPATVVVERGPYPPPPPRVEYRPAPPPYAVVWVRGHWRWNGYRWIWISGHYRRV
jgi:hypothetical protein